MLLFSHDITDHFYYEVDKGICLFLLLLELKIGSIWKGNGKFNHMGASGNRHHEFGLVSVLVKSESDLIFLLVRYTLSLPKRKRQGGVLNSCPQQPAALRRRHCHGRAFLSSLEYCTLSRVSGLTPFLVPFKNFLLLQHLSNNNLLLECPGGLVAARENVLTTSLTFFPSKI